MNVLENACGCVTFIGMLAAACTAEGSLVTAAAFAAVAGIALVVAKIGGETEAEKKEKDRLMLEHKSVMGCMDIHQTANEVYHISSEKSRRI